MATQESILYKYVYNAKTDSPTDFRICTPKLSRFVFAPPKMHKITSDVIYTEKSITLRVDKS